MKRLSPMLIVLMIGHPIIAVMIGISTISVVIAVIPYATCQLKSKKQSHYPEKEFPFVHSNHPFPVI